MKRSFVVAVLVVAISIFAAVAFAMDHGHGGGKGCHYCGMDLVKFANSAMVIEYDDGTKAEVCSIHCAAVDLALNIGKTPVSFKVGDQGTKKKIDAEKAYWVIDDMNPGVMTSRAKWAFKDKKDANDYITSTCEGSGTVVSFEAALKAAYEDMYEDTKMIRNKRKMMKKKGMKHKH